MYKKGQIQSNVFMIIITILIFSIILLFGFTAIKNIDKKKCEMDYLDFIKEWTDKLPMIAYDEKINENFIMPCEINKIILVDKRVDEPLIGLKNYPLINNELKENSANVFLLKDDYLKKSFDIENLKIKFPYFECYNTNNKNLEIIFYNDGSINTMSKDPKYDCFIMDEFSMELKEDDLNEIINEISKDYITIKKEDLINITQCNFTRKFENDNDTTKIIITNNGCNFRVFEKIPKCAVTSIQTAISSGLLTYGNINPSIINDDPLMMWDFDQSEDEAYYEIKRLIDESCKKEFKAIGTEIKTDNEINQELTDSLDNIPTIIQDQRDDSFDTEIILESGISTDCILCEDMHIEFRKSFEKYFVAESDSMFEKLYSLKFEVENNGEKLIEIIMDSYFDPVKKDEYKAHIENDINIVRENYEEHTTQPSDFYVIDNQGATMIIN